MNKLDNKSLVESLTKLYIENKQSGWTKNLVNDELLEQMINQTISFETYKNIIQIKIDE